MRCPRSQIYIGPLLTGVNAARHHAQSLLQWEGGDGFRCDHAKAQSIADVFWRAARPSDLAYGHTRNPYIYVYMYTGLGGGWLLKTDLSDRPPNSEVHWQSLVSALDLGIGGAAVLLPEMSLVDGDHATPASSETVALAYYSGSSS